MTNPDLSQMLDAFIAGTDVSLPAANAIEVALGDRFPDDDYVQETVVLLAMFRPGGMPGEPLLDEAAIQQRLVHTRYYLNRRLGRDI